PNWTGPGAPCPGYSFGTYDLTTGTYSFLALVPGPYRLRAYALRSGVVTHSDAAGANVTTGLAIVNFALPGGSTNSGTVPTAGGAVTPACTGGTELHACS